MKKPKLEGMTSTLAATMESVLEAVYHRSDDIGVKLMWTYGGYIIEIDKSSQVIRLKTFEDCLEEIKEFTD
jgi:hypothetical protein